MSLKCIVIILAVALLCYPIYLWITYIDDAITSGSKYGFDIGDTKSETYSKLNTVFNNSDDEVFIQIRSNAAIEAYLATKNDFNVLIKPSFHKIGYENFSKDDVWQFYFNGSYTNSLTLTFCEEKLCRIYRHRKYFEFP